jgi:hypothetical protein
MSCIPTVLLCILYRIGSFDTVQFQSKLKITSHVFFITVITIVHRNSTADPDKIIYYPKCNYVANVKHSTVFYKSYMFNILIIRGQT